MKTIASAILVAFLADAQVAPPAAAAPLPALVAADPGSYECGGQFSPCAGRTLNVKGTPGWGFKCNGDCRGMTINLEVGYDPLHPGLMTQYIGEITCSTPGGCAGMTLNVVNSFCDPTATGAEQVARHNMITRLVEINDIRCEAPGACDGMTINAQCGVDIMKTNFDCQLPGSCVGCIVKDMFELKSCDQNQNPNGAMLLPHQVTYLGLPPPPAGCVAASQRSCLPAYGPFKTDAALPNFQNGYMNAPLPQQPVAPVPQQPAQPAPLAPEPAQPQPAQTYEQSPYYHPYFNPYGIPPSQMVPQFYP